MQFDDFRDKKDQFCDKTINELVKASYEMAKQKTGALIVIEQNINLGDYIKTGIDIDAYVSNQLLINIFEHNTPIIALSIEIAQSKKIRNFSILNSLKTMPQAMESLVLNPNLKVDAFLCPGHVATIIGEEQFKNLALKYKIPMVITGFEINDILASICKIVEMKNKCENELVNLYSRFVKKEGNINAINIIYEVFNECESYWRGLGKVNNAGLEIKEKYKEFDSLSKFNISFLKENDNKGCSCGEVLIGFLGSDNWKKLSDKVHIITDSSIYIFNTFAKDELRRLCSPAVVMDGWTDRVTDVSDITI